MLGKQCYAILNDVHTGQATVNEKHVFFPDGNRMLYLKSAKIESLISGVHPVYILRMQERSSNRFWRDGRTLFPHGPLVNIFIYKNQCVAPNRFLL
jgi:hypothetical protein